MLKTVVETIYVKYVNHNSFFKRIHKIKYCNAVLVFLRIQCIDRNIVHKEIYSEMLRFAMTLKKIIPRKTNKTTVYINNINFNDYVTFFSFFNFSPQQYKAHSSHNNNQQQNYSYNHWEYEVFWWPSICLFFTKIDSRKINEPNIILK